MELSIYRGNSHTTQRARLLAKTISRHRPLQTLGNLDRVLAGFDATRLNLAYVEIYLTNAQEHSEQVIRLFKEYVGLHRPAGSLIGVTYLASPEQLIEISAVAHSD